MSIKTASKMKGRLAAALAAGFAFLGLAESAQAQEIQVSGPLAGAPAVRKLRLYRKGRFEVAPNVTFTLLDEYQRHILFGARLNYNITDWLAIGAWGAHGSLKLPTALSDNIQEVNEERKTTCAQQGQNLDCRLTAANVGQDFRDQLAGIDYVISPQLTAVPFRGKLGLFSSIYVDTDLYFFGGPAFIGLQDRGDCSTGSCDSPESFELANRTTIAPTFGLGLTFYINKWSAIGAEYRGLPFAWNPGGFDTAGRGKDDAFPDGAISDADLQYQYHQMITVSFNMYVPFEYKVSE